MSTDEEVFDIVDNFDRVIGQALRSDCHGNPALIHRAVHVIVINDRGDLLLQKRSRNKDIQPGRWDTSVGGHLLVGESYRAAARREMAEELGIINIPLTFLYYSKIRNEVESENVATYLAQCTTAVQVDPYEIEEVRFWSAMDIENAIGTGLLTPNFEQEWNMYQNFTRCYLSSTGENCGICAGDSLPDLIRELSDSKV